MFYRLKKNTVLRNDITRTVIYFKEGHNEDNMNYNLDSYPVFNTLDPSTAISFYLMDGSRTLTEIIDEVKHVFDEMPEEKVNAILKTIEKLQYYYEILPEKCKPIDWEPVKNILPDLNTVQGYNMEVNQMNLPLSMLLIPTMDCVVDCAYCYADRKTPFIPMDYSIVEKIVLEAADVLKMRNITISGGDIFLYKEHEKLLRLLAAKGYFPELPTKCPLSLNKLIFLKEIGFKSFQFSLDGFDADVIRRHFGLKDPESYINQMILSIKNACDIGMKISINSVVSQCNYKQLENFLTRIISIDNVYRVNLSPVGYSLYKRETMSELMLNAKDFDFIKEHFENIFDKVKQKITFFKKPDASSYWGNKTNEITSNQYFERSLCSAFRFAMVVLPDGKVTGCEELYWHPDFIIGDLTKQSISEAWATPKRKNIISPKQSDFSNDSPCFYCDEVNFNKCHSEKGRCWREILKFYDRHDFPDYRCPISKEIANNKNLVLKTNSQIWDL